MIRSTKCRSSWRCPPVIAVALLATLAAGAACSSDRSREGAGADEPASGSDSSDRSSASEGASRGEDGADQASGRAFVAATEYAFSVSGSLDEGTGTLEFRNDGTQLHMLAIHRLRQGGGTPQLAQAIQGGDRAAVEAAIEPEEIGAPGGALGPGHRQSVAATTLKAGRYAIVCLYPAPDGKSHAAKGMVGELTVEASKEAPAPRPADHQVAISAGSIEGAPTALSPGNTTFEVRAGGGTHNFLAVRLEEGKSYPDVEAYFRALLQPGGSAATPPPGELVGLVYEFSDGQSIRVTFDLEPGRYFLGCAFADDQPDQTSDDHYSRAEHVELVVS